MDDDFKEPRRNKPQQKIYKPGSGPLRKSNDRDLKMSSYDVVSRNRSRDRSFYGSKNSIYEEDSSKEQMMTSYRKKPDQQHYVARSADCKSEIDRQSNSGRCDDSSQSYNRRRNDKHGYNSGYSRGQREGNNDYNYNRNYRQVSEPRSSSPSHYTKGRDHSLTDRNRDSKSMETSANRHMPGGGGGKPPTGRRNSAGYVSDSPRPKYTFNLDNLPPRLRKKYLEKNGHSFDSVDHSNKYQSNSSGQNTYNQGPVYDTTASWSQTLPSRGRGRLRDNENFDPEKFIHTYLKSTDMQNSRRSTPSNSYMNLYETTVYENADSNHTLSNETKQSVAVNGVRNDSKKPTAKEQEYKQESDSEAVSYNSMNFGDMTSLDWTEEVEKESKIFDESSTSSPLFQLKSTPPAQEIKAVDTRSSEPRESKRKSKRREKKSGSRGHRGGKGERARGEPATQDAPPPTAPPARERRDSHRSNRSSNIGNSRDDLDRWRSLRSFSREHSTEGRIVSQCNSRDVSANRDHDGFRVPLAVNKNGNNQKKNGGWSGRGASSERVVEGGEAPAGGGRRSRRRNSRRHKNSESAAPPPPPPAVSATTAATTNWRDEIKESKKHSTQQDRLDRNQEVNRNRLNSCQSDKSESSNPHPGLLILPQGSIQQSQKDKMREGSVDTQKTLFDHHNPNKPIVVQSQNKVDARLDRASSEWWAMECGALGSGGGGGGGGGSGCGAAAAATAAAGEAERAARHRPLLQQVDRADAVLQAHMLRGPLVLAAHWTDVTENRKFLQNALQQLLLSDLKYCQADNVEHHFWKILYYTFIEKLRKSLTQVTPDDKTRVVKLINTIIEEGNTYFTDLVHLLETTYRFNTDDYISGQHLLPPKGLGYVGLALISVQKLYVFLGDLARYKEQVNETNNYAKSKYWYTKAQQINPKNGRPYNQLAILAIYARRKLDAVYYYMRSLMSSNPFHSARESLISLFDENRKKYEAAERKRKAALDTLNGNAEGSDNRTVKESRMGRQIWVRPTDGPTATPQRTPDDGLASMTPVELNKNFITSYLHVHGKLVTKIGWNGRMETLNESAAVMLRQFRALLRQQPLPIPGQRLLQLTALNMFAVESTAGTNKAAGEKRSAWLESALAVSLLMFGALLERCCALLPEPPHTQQHTDALLLLPAIKVWSDWMLCHSSLWNPPPSLVSYDTGSELSPWDWLAKLMNILESLDDKTIVFESESKEGYEPVHLSEDVALSGFTPLMYMEPAVAFVRRAALATLTPHIAEHTLRTRKLLFFGTEYLVGVDPPVLGVEYGKDSSPRYVSAVPAAAEQPPLQNLVEESAEDLQLMERKSSNSEGTSTPDLDVSDADEATRRLLKKKELLEQRRADMERRKLRMQELLSAGAVVVQTEVRPRWLVPDTNCFVVHLPLLRRLARRTQLAVPLVVVTELEGLRNCSRIGDKATEALSWLSVDPVANGIRFATSRGSLLNSRAFTAEQQESARATNDDRVLATALSLHANITSEPDVDVGGSDCSGVRCVRRVCEVVLLTDDRGLRVKALAADLPVRDLPSFVTWMFDEHENAASSEGARGEASH